MTVRLTIRTAAWRASVAQLASRVDGLVPVVKGNGYGFGRIALAEIARELSDTVAVGTVHELDGLPGGCDVMVLTPTHRAPATTEPILTVGRAEHVEALAGWRGRVVVKMRSSMRRYGTDDVEGLIDRCRERHLTVAGVSIHPPLAGTSADHRAEVVEALASIDRGHTVWLSHLDREQYGQLPTSHTYRLRLGTALWLGRRDALHLQADVTDLRSVAAGEPAGYRLTPAATDGTLVMVGAGTAHGVTALPDGRSPFHHARQRMPLLEPPHMHTSMCLVPDGQPVPAVGEWVDVQRPLTMTAVDEYVWS